MKKLIFACMLCMTVPTMAQNTWEMAETGEAKGNPDQKYLTGAVPMEDGKVVFSTTIEAPGKSAAEIYAIVKKYLVKMISEPNQFEQSRIIMDDPQAHTVAGSYQEWLVFKATALVLDRTRFMYNLAAECSDGQAKLKLTRIVYLYEEERDPQTLKAEEWITDQYGLNHKKTKLSRVSGKFRRKTIDRKDYLFDKIASLLK